MQPRPQGERRLGTVGVTASAMVLAVATLLVSGARGTVEATTVAEAEVTTRLSVTTWRAAPAPSGGTHLGMPLTPDWTTRGGDAIAVLDVVNVGEVALSTQTIVVREMTTGATPNERVDVTACVGGVWNPNGTACPGTTLALGDAASGPLATGFPLEPDERVSVRLSARRATVARSQLAVDVTVDRGAVRSATAPSG